MKRAVGRRGTGAATVSGAEVNNKGASGKRVMDLGLLVGRSIRQTRLACLSMHA
jgi:hypothetical protein